MPVSSEVFHAASSQPCNELAPALAGTGAESPVMASDCGPHGGGVRILVVEDDADVCETIGRLLRQAGYQVDSASDGEAGWDALLHYRFNLLLTDNRMPRLTGVELIGRLRAAGSTLPAILASGTLPWDEAQVPQALQPLGTIAKPFSGYELLRKVREALRLFAPAASLGESHRESVAGSSGRKWWNGRSSPHEPSLAAGLTRN